jgi:hypothetical protein
MHWAWLDTFLNLSFCLQEEILKVRKKVDAEAADFPWAKDSA